MLAGCDGLQPPTSIPLSWYAHGLDLSSRGSATPRIAWSFWDKGTDMLPQFRRLCVETWAAQNPHWEIAILDQRNVFEYLSPSELPRLWPEMYRFGQDLRNYLLMHAAFKKMIVAW
eukprot:Skav234458  [mRNA]  locus=scaffold1647:158342:162291:+ [translate_table: standard]